MSKPYKFSERSTLFAKNVRSFVKKLPRNCWNLEDTRQLVRSSGSIGANYMEASEAMSKKDAAKSLKISRKESKETGYWLELLDVDGDENLHKHRMLLLQESQELMKILNAMIHKIS